MNPVEIVARHLAKDLTETEEGWWECFTDEARPFIRALEQAGDKIVGPDPTGPMVRAAQEAFERKEKWGEILRAAIAAAPTWSTDNG